MAWLLLAALAGLLWANHANDERGHVATGVFTSERVDMLIGAAGLMWVALFLLSFAL